MIAALITKIYSVNSQVGSSIQCDYSLLDDSDPSPMPGGTIYIDQTNPQDSIMNQLSTIVDQANLVKSLKPLEGEVVQTKKQPLPTVEKQTDHLTSDALSADSQAQ